MRRANSPQKTDVDAIWARVEEIETLRPRAALYMIFHLLHLLERGQC